MQTSKRASVLLWIVQGMLAALFLFAGSFKLFAPVAMLQGPVARSVVYGRRQWAPLDWSTQQLRRSPVAA